MKFLIGAAFALAAAAPAAANFIDFQDKERNVLPGPFVYADQGVEFESNTGQIYVGAGALLSETHEICATDGHTCNGTITVQFTGPVNDVSFDIYGLPADGDPFLFNVVTDRMIYTLTAQGDTDGDFWSHQDLSRYHNITAIVLGGGTELGYAYDYFSFTPGAVATPAPEPTSWALMLGGFGLVGGAMRRRRRRSDRVAFA